MSNLVVRIPCCLIKSGVKQFSLINVISAAVSIRQVSFILAILIWINGKISFISVVDVASSRGMKFNGC